MPGSSRRARDVRSLEEGNREWANRKLDNDHQSQSLLALRFGRCNRRCRNANGRHLTSALPAH